MHHQLTTIAAVALSAIAGATLSSCFKAEPLNAEADIEKAVVDVDNPEAFFYNATDAAIDVLSDQTLITFEVRSSADLTAMAPTFTLTPGATITPPSGSVHDFSDGPVTYVVTSQDGHTTRTYTVAFRRVSHTVTEVWNFNFEHYELDPNYNQFYVWHNTLPDGTLASDWASGNAGFKMSRSKAKADEFPTVPDPNGYEGSCVHLITRDTGPFGHWSNKPIAAGNMFLGVFDISVAAMDPLKATRFGIPFIQKPVKMTGYYKFHPGEVFTDKNLVQHPERKDLGDIYAVLYRNHDKEGNAVVLYGDNVLSSDLIVAVARIPKTETVSEWTAFDIPFTYNKDLDMELLQNRGYSLTIVFSSSIEGATFEGAIGSELWVDQVKLYTETEE